MTEAEREHVQELEDELKIALMYIMATKKQIFDARMGEGDMHDAILEMIKNCPNMIYDNTRILLREEDKTFLELSRVDHA